MTKKAGKSLKEKVALKNHLLKEGLAELLGTFILVALGCGCVAQTVLSRGVLGGALMISVGFAMAVTVAIYVAGGISGGHINPAVSFAMCLTGKMKWVKFPGPALLPVASSTDALMFYTNGIFAVKGPNATAHIFATYPQEYLSLTNGFADQMMSTAFLILGVFAIIDTDNLGVPKGLEPIAIGLLIILLTSSMALNSGCAMNPARDLGPRLFTYLAGWGGEVFTAGHNWWWVPIAGPMVGAALGAATYMLFIEVHHFPLSPCQKMDTGALHEHELTHLEEGK
ncbi:hypothetical protein Chor_014624 [Crotalus horridus]